MIYDHQKVQAWLNLVPEGRALALWLLVLSVGLPLTWGSTLEFNVLLKTFCDASLWERTNMLYGLRDLCAAEQAQVTQRYARQARRLDDGLPMELDFETRGRLPEELAASLPAITITMAPTPENCPVCQQPYVHHQHPMKPLGVIINSTCGCNPTTEQADGQGHGPGEADRRSRGSGRGRR